MPDSPEPEVKRDDLLRLTSEITAAHVSNNTVALADLPALIEQVYRTLATVGAGSENVPDRPIPAVPVKKSVTPEHTLCRHTGKKLKKNGRGTCKGRER